MEVVQFIMASNMVRLHGALAQLRGRLLPLDDPAVNTREERPKEAATTTEVNWWDGKLDGLLECQQRIMELYPADVRARLNEDSLLNNYEKFTEQPHPAGWEGYYTRPTLGGTCYVTKN